MIVFYSLGGVSWGRSLGCHGFLDQMFDDKLPLLLYHSGLIALGVGDILAGLFVVSPLVDFVVELDIVQLPLLIG